MATITTINANDAISDSRTDINNNFANLNSDKIETSYLDTDTTMAANSDTKIATQKAVKTYIDTSGGANASTTARGIVEEATQAELTAGTTTGGTGARLFVNPTHTVSTSAGAGDEGKIPKLNSSGLLDTSMLTWKGLVSTGISGFDISTASGNQSIAHSLGVVPKLIRLTVICGTNSHINYAFGTYTAASSVYSYADFPLGAASVATGTSYMLMNDDGGDQRGTFGTQTSTNIVISWTKNSSPTGGNITVMWEAYA